LLLILHKNLRKNLKKTEKKDNIEDTSVKQETKARDIKSNNLANLFGNDNEDILFPSEKSTTSNKNESEKILATTPKTDALFSLAPTQTTKKSDPLSLFSGESDSLFGDVPPPKKLPPKEQKKNNVVADPVGLFGESSDSVFATPKKPEQKKIVEEPKKEEPKKEEPKKQEEKSNMLFSEDETLFNTTKKDTKAESKKTETPKKRIYFIVW